MGLFDDVFSKVSDTSKNLNQSAKIKIKESKLKKKGKILEEEMNQELRLLGAEVYDLLEKGEKLPDFKERRQKIKDNYQAILENNEDLSKITKSMTRCPECSSLYEADFDYCPVCGKKRD